MKVEIPSSLPVSITRLISLRNIYSGFKIYVWFILFYYIEVKDAVEVTYNEYKIERVVTLTNHSFENCFKMPYNHLFRK